MGGFDKELAPHLYAPTPSLHTAPTVFHPCVSFSLCIQQVPRVRSTQQQAVNFRNSTFFPSYKPRVYMEDNDDVNSMASSDDLADISVGSPFSQATFTIG